MSQSSTIPDRLKHWADLYPNKEVFVFYSDDGRRALTCKDVFVLAMKFAALLQRRGLKQGDVVCNTLTNSPERVVTDFGIMAAGCIAANAQALLTDGTDMLHVINLSQCRLIVADHTLPGGAWDLLKGHLGEVVDLQLKSGRAPKLEMVEFVGVAKETQFLQELLKEDDPTPVQISPTDTALYWNTSGSSGFSKVVAYNHSTMILMSSNFAVIFQVKESDKLYSDRPLGWGGGWAYMFVHFGMTQVLTDTRGSVADQCSLTWNSVNTEQCTFAILTIAFMKKLLERNDLLEQKRTAQLNKVVATGQPFRQHCYDVVGKICHTVISSYGLTEAGYVTSCFCEAEDDFLDNLVGTSTDLVKIKIADKEFKEVAPGESGHVLIQGATVMDGYVNNPEATRAAFTDEGWLKTGDVGMRDDKGRLLIEGRQSDAIMHGEYIIYPSWVEKKLRTCPLVGEVMVVGLPDQTMHHQICACVISKSGITVTGEMLKEYCDPMFTENTLQEMSAKPKFYILVKSFPTRPTGKPDRGALADLAANIVSSQDKH